jgi:DNA replication licensing factor MCM4
LLLKDSDKDIFHSMAQDKYIIEKLIKSFAPSIHGHTAIKKGILAQLFGGTKKKVDIGNERNPDKGNEQARCRSDINICLVGDPSTAKSQLLQQVYKIAPRGIYTSGRGSSAVGLTANVKKDPETK